MTKRTDSSGTPIRSTRSRTKVLTVTMFAETERELREMAAEEGVSIRTLLHETIAISLRLHGRPLPDQLVKYLEDHDRPVPPARRRRARHELN